MRRGLYRKLAWTGIKKNKKLYMPYILTCIGMVMMCYIISFLGNNRSFASVEGGETAQSLLRTGFGVMCVFAFIFLFYTHSFLIRRRKKEFGLYNILGMGNGDLTRVLGWESGIMAFMTLAGGLFLGVLLSKFAEMGLMKILGSTAGFSLEVEGASLGRTAVLFLAIYFVIFLNTFWQIWRSDPIELFHSEKAGEKPPKGNAFIAIVGLICLAVAYYMAVTIENPLEALSFFFVAVILVVIATYMLFIAGSVTFCRLLGKNKGYYYKTAHFVSVSSMIYRMKRNGAGLASICILCTMVLVMVSSTVCLYMGAEDSLRARYPRDIDLNSVVSSTHMLGSGYADQVRGLAEDVCEEYGAAMDNVLDYRQVFFYGFLSGDRIDLVPPDEMNSLSAVDDMWSVYVVPREDYERLTGTDETLESGEALVYATKGKDRAGESLSVGDALTLDVKKQVDDLVDMGNDMGQVTASMYIFVPDFDQAADRLIESADPSVNSVSLNWIYGFDMDCTDDIRVQAETVLSERVLSLEAGIEENEFFHTLIEGRASGRTNFYSMYGGLFYLGILLGISCVLAAVLIIYYKQVSEGYEDQSRFEIMQKVGMTRKEIRKSINSQILTVFFMPLIMAGVHLAFAFPIIRRMLLLFALTNTTLLVLTMAGCYLVFVAFYMFVYRATSKAYYHIVSGTKGRETEM